jgi:hypothetical protein
VLPRPLRLAIPIIRRMQRKKLHAQGTGRHSPDEIAAIGKADWDAISTLLGDKTFLFGDRPSTFETSLYGFLEATLGFPGGSPVRRHLSTIENLVRYRDHVKKTYFPELHSDAATA